MDMNRGQTKLHGHEQGQTKLDGHKQGQTQLHGHKQGQTKPNRVIRFTILHVYVHMGPP